MGNQDLGNEIEFLECLLEEQASVEVMHQQIRGGRLVRRTTGISPASRCVCIGFSGSLSATDFITGVSYNLNEENGIILKYVLQLKMNHKVV